MTLTEKLIALVAEQECLAPGLAYVDLADLNDLAKAAASMAMLQDADDCDAQANALNRATVDKDLIGREVALAMVGCLHDRAIYIRLRAASLSATSSE